MGNEEVEELAARLRAGRDEDLLAGLRGADLSGADLTHANLRGADLREADLSGAHLHGADLTEAHLGGAALSSADLSGAHLCKADLSMVDATWVDLSESDLSGASLWGAKLLESDLSGADLSRADLTEANLSLVGLREVAFWEADLTNVVLTEVDLSGASLSMAILYGAKIMWADLSGADLSGADLTGAVLVGTTLPPTIFAAAKVAGIDMDWRTIARSLRVDGLRSFLVRTGMPEVLAIYMIDALRSIDETDLFTMLQSVFLAYGEPDREFAEQLRRELTHNGVKTWYFPRDAGPGARIKRHLSRQINSYDRMVLVCSQASLKREGVLAELEEVLEREHDEGESEVLIPIMIESIVETGQELPEWWPKDREHIYRALRRRVGADFCGALGDKDKWGEQIGKLLRALRKRPKDG